MTLIDMFTRAGRSFCLAAVCLVAMSQSALPAAAQLTPERTYNGLRRPMMFRVEAPGGEGLALRVTLHNPGQSEPIAESSVQAGEIDLGAVFPVLWEDSERRRVVYAQLHAGETPLGSPVVLQPMSSVNSASLGPDRRSIVFADDQWAQAFARGQVATAQRPASFSGYIAYQERHVVLETSAGPIEVRMRPDEAPNTVRHILDLVEGGFYTDIIFHRIINRNPSGNPFVIQVGDPVGTGTGGPGFNVDLENSALEHDFGVVSMARSGDPNSGGSQVFICLSRAGTSGLDGSYTAFAEAVSGAEAIQAIAASPTGANDRPIEPPVLKRAYTIPAPPFGSGPPRVVRPEPAGTQR